MPKTWHPVTAGERLRGFLESKQNDITEFLCDLIRFPSIRGNEGPAVCVRRKSDANTRCVSLSIFFPSSALKEARPSNFVGYILPAGRGVS